MTEEGSSDRSVCHSISLYWELMGDLLFNNASLCPQHLILYHTFCDCSLCHPPSFSFHPYFLLNWPLFEYPPPFVISQPLWEAQFSTSDWVCHSDITRLPTKCASKGHCDGRGAQVHCQTSKKGALNLGHRHREAPLSTIHPLQASATHFYLSNITVLHSKTCSSAQWLTIKE